MPHPPSPVPRPVPGLRSVTCEPRDNTGLRRTRNQRGRTVPRNHEWRVRNGTPSFPHTSRTRPERPSSTSRGALPATTTCVSLSRSWGPVRRRTTPEGLYPEPCFPPALTVRDGKGSGGNIPRRSRVRSPGTSEIGTSTGRSGSPRPGETTGV